LFEVLEVPSPDARLPRSPGSIRLAPSRDLSGDGRRRTDCASSRSAIATACETKYRDVVAARSAEKSWITEFDSRNVQHAPAHANAA